MGYIEYCEEQYNSAYLEKYQAFLNNRITEAARTESERRAQHEALLETFTAALSRYEEEADAAQIWNALYRAHLLRKANIANLEEINEEVIDAIVSGAQSWKKTSGHVFEDYLTRTTAARLAAYNIRLLLQKELTQMLEAGIVGNDPTDDLEEISKSDNFDAYAIVDVNGTNLVFGCIQVKTSIRDRVGRDRDFSIPMMENHFWSVAVVLDGSYLAMPKFANMVNGGGRTQYIENGWHGMYVMSKSESNDRIYKDPHFDRLIEDAQQAARRFTSARQIFNRGWRAEH